MSYRTDTTQEFKDKFNSFLKKNKDEFLEKFLTKELHYLAMYYSTGYHHIIRLEKKRNNGKYDWKVSLKRFFEAIIKHSVSELNYRMEDSWDQENKQGLYQVGAEELGGDSIVGTHHEFWDPSLEYQKGE